MKQTHGDVRLVDYLINGHRIQKNVWLGNKNGVIAWAWLRLPREK